VAYLQYTSLALRAKRATCDLRLIIYFCVYKCIEFIPVTSLFVMVLSLLPDLDTSDPWSAYSPCPDPRLTFVVSDGVVSSPVLQVCCFVCGVRCSHFYNTPYQKYL